jgi:hypothetical protein
MPCIKVLSVNLPGQNEKTTRPSLSNVITFFFCQLSCDGLIIKNLQKCLEITAGNNRSS